MMMIPITRQQRQRQQSQFQYHTHSIMSIVSFPSSRWYQR